MDVTKREAHRAFVRPGALQTFLRPASEVAAVDLSSCELTDTDVDELLAAGFTDLRSLRLDSNLLTAASAVTIAESGLPIQELSLSHNEIESEGFTALVESALVPGLVSLEAGWARVDEAGVVALAASSAMPRLRKLDLSGAEEGALSGSEVWARLADAKWMASITDLLLASNDLGERILTYLVTTPLFDRVEALCLRDCGLSAEYDGEKLSSGSRGQTLRELDVSENSFSLNGDIEHWRWLERLSGLVKLRIGYRDHLGDPNGPLTKEGWKSLINACASRCQAVDFMGMMIHGDRFVALFEREWPGLITLGLQNNGIDAETIRSTGTRNSGLHPRTLLLGDNPIKDAGLSALTSAFWTAQLCELNVAGCGITMEGIRALEKWAAPIEILDISRNRLDVSVGQALRAMGAHHLRVIRMSNCGLSEDELADIVISLAGNPGFLELDFSGQTLTPQTLQLLCDGRSFPLLERLSYGGISGRSIPEVESWVDQAEHRGLVLTVR